MNQERITQLLNHSNEAGSACRDALLDGAELILWRGSAPADRMLAAYRRRYARAVADAVESIGFTEALDDLRRAGTRELNLGQVTVADPAYVYMIFTTEDPPTLVACVGIARD
jgi:hypothetical protein